MHRAGRFSRVSIATALASTLLIAFALSSSQALDMAATVRLYALDGGSIEFADLAMMSDTGEFDGKSAKFAAPAFLVRHPKGNLLWDTGLGDGLAKSGPVSLPIGIKMSVSKPLIAQLAEIDMKPENVDFVSFSHLHADHTGNANLFPNATWLIGQKELSWARGKPTPAGVDPRTFSAGKKIKSDDQDIDVFGDGRVRILRAPGHTPDHRVLLLKLAHDGNLILSGDLYHMRESVKRGTVPVHNVSRADTQASFDRIGKLLKQYGAKLIVQHAAEDFAGLPKFPLYLD